MPREPTISALAIERSRRLRRDAPVPERVLWGILRDRRLGGMKFRRQHVIEPYIVDFYCPEVRLIVELDGMSHDNRTDKDKKRTAYLEQKGNRLIRFTNADLLKAADAVAQEILQATKIRSPPLPSARLRSPLPPGEG